MSNVPFCSPSPVDEAIHAHAKECQRIVDEAISESVSGLTFLECLKGAGTTPDEAQDYIEQFTACRRIQVSGSSNTGGQPPGQPNSDAPNLIDAAMSIAWAFLHAKVNHLQSNSSQATAAPSSSLSDELANLLGLPSSKGAIPSSILAKAPHLAKLSDPTASDPHLEKTQDLLSVYCPQHSQDILVNKAQFTPVGDPLPRTIWWKILLNSFVNFEKLFASMDNRYDHHDDPKDFRAGYALIKKDQAFSKRPLCTEADWMQVFMAWFAGVVFFFPHRDTELREYHTIVMDLFHAAPSNPLIAISFDVHVRDKYSKKPFHLDDQAQLNFPLLTQMLLPASPVASPTNKQVASSQPPASVGGPKRVDVPCCNWSLGSCKSEICPNCRKHGICCICREGH